MGWPFVETKTAKEMREEQERNRGTEPPVPTIDPFKKFATPVQVDPTPFNPTVDTRTNTSRVTSGLQRGSDLFRDPTGGAIGVENAPTVSTPTPVTAVTHRGDSGLMSTDRALDLSGASRFDQGSNIEQLQGFAQGGGTAGQAMYERGAEKAAELMRLAGQQTNQQVMDQAGAAARAQASMAARGRGGMMGAAMLNAQNQAASAHQAAARQGGFALQDANIRAGMVGKDMMAQGAELASKEQLAFAGMLTDALGVRRSQDIDHAGAATAMGNLGATIDKMVGDTSKFNSAQEHDAAKFNAMIKMGILTADQADELQRLGIGSSMIQAFTSMGISMGQFNREMLVRLASLQADMENNAQVRGANIYTGSATNATNSAIASANRDSQESQAWITGLTGAGAALAPELFSFFRASDRRAKTDIRPAENAVLLMQKALRPVTSDRLLKKDLRPQDEDELRKLARDKLGMVDAPEPQRLSQEEEKNIRDINAPGLAGTTFKPPDVSYSPAEAQNIAAANTGMQLNPGAASLPSPVPGAPMPYVSPAPAHPTTQEELDRMRAANLMRQTLLTSDRDAKTDIKPADFRKAKAYRYRYKDPKHGKGEFVGPMAQDMPPGTVVEKDGVKMVDTSRVVMLMASAVGAQQKRLDKLEGKSA